MYSGIVLSSDNTMHLCAFSIITLVQKKNLKTKWIHLSDRVKDCFLYYF